jgi:hypothetical protein
MFIFLSRFIRQLLMERFACLLLLPAASPTAMGVFGASSGVSQGQSGFWQWLSGVLL